MLNGLRARVAKRDFRSMIDVLLVHEREDGRRSIAKPLEMIEIPHGECVASETFSLDSLGAQQLMDDLWSAGVRPTEGHGSSGQIGAVQAHLKDMRKLVSKIMKVEL